MFDLQRSLCTSFALADIQLKLRFINKNYNHPHFIRIRPMCLTAAVNEICQMSVMKFSWHLLRVRLNFIYLHDRKLLLERCHLGLFFLTKLTWWRHQMETFSALLALCAGNSPVYSPHKGQWRGASIFSLIWACSNSWANKGDAGDLRCHGAHYDVIVMNYTSLLIEHV